MIHIGLEIKEHREADNGSFCSVNHAMLLVFFFVGQLHIFIDKTVFKLLNYANMAMNIY